MTTSDNASKSNLALIRTAATVVAVGLAGPGFNAIPHQEPPSYLLDVRGLTLRAVRPLREVLGKLAARARRAHCFQAFNRFF